MYKRQILSRLIEISVGPVEQVPPCACKAPRSSPTDSRPPSHSANNVIDTDLPYNHPWYGSYTEHRLQAMSIDDGATQVQIISPLRTVLAKPLVHGEEEWNKVEGLDQDTSVTEMTSMSPSNEAVFVGLVERNLNVHAPSAELHTKVDDSAEKDETASVAVEVSIATQQTSVPVTLEEKSASQMDSSDSKQNAESAKSEAEKSADKVGKTSDTGGEFSQREKPTTEFPINDNSQTESPIDKIQTTLSKTLESETIQQVKEESTSVCSSADGA